MNPLQKQWLSKVVNCLLLFEGVKRMTLKLFRAKKERHAKKIARLKTIQHLLKFNFVFYINPFVFSSQRRSLVSSQGREDREEGTRG